MIKFAVSLECAVEVTPEFQGEVFDPASVLEAHFDQVMDELLKLNAVDPSIDASLAAATVTFSVVVEAVNPIAAVEEASGVVRTAVHAAGGGTPDWPSSYDGAWGVRLVGVGSRELLEA